MLTESAARPGRDQRAGGVHRRRRQAAGLGVALQGTPLPERVAGSDLIFHLCEEAAEKGFRVFLLGGGEGVAEQAARRLMDRYHGLQIVGTACPPYRRADSAGSRPIVIERSAAAQPDLLIVAFTMPKGERWIVDEHRRAGSARSSSTSARRSTSPPGRIRRAPHWMQKTGLEWAFRLGLEPRRLFRRYAQNAWFIARMLGRDLADPGRSTSRSPPWRREPRSRANGFDFPDRPRIREPTAVEASETVGPGPACRRPRSATSPDVDRGPPRRNDQI